MKKIATVLGCLSLLAGVAGAQVTVAASTSMTIGTVLSLNVTNTTVAFASPTNVQFNAGLEASSTTSSISAAGNVRHSVVIWTGAATMTGSGGGAAPDAVNAAKAVSDFQWSNGGAYTGLVASGSSSNGGKVINQHARGTSSATINYQMLLSYATDTPGTYSLSFNYTVIAD